MVGFRGSWEWASEPELEERLLGHAFDAGGVRCLAAGMGVIGKSAHLDRVLRRAVARYPNEVQMERLTEPVQARGDLGLFADAAVSAWRKEEPIQALSVPTLPPEMSLAANDARCAAAARALRTASCCWTWRSSADRPEVWR